jgi:Ni/Co efflux regulator RcnB
MNKSLLALATTALLLGGVATASAQSYERPYDGGYSAQYDDRYDPNYDPRYDDRNDDRYDERYDERYEARDDSRYDQRYDPRYDQRYDSRDGRRQTANGRGRDRDRDCDGIPNRYDRNSGRNAHDRDCDGIVNRFDRHDGRYHTARRSYASPRYMAPAGYSYSRYSYGTRLPRNYWGSRYYVDYQPYGLAPPPSGYRWNRVGNDVYMINTRDGLIAEVIYSLFR